MVKKILAVLVILLLAGFLFAKVKYKRVASSDFDFPTEQTANLAELVKQRAVDAKPPNVVILLADDLGWADVGYHGSDIQTPNIDRLAKEGMRLERFYATPFCTPTRAALMTGRDPIKLGAAHAVFMAWDNGGISPEEHFMPESFREAGYQTAMVGKWHLGHTIEQHTPNARGFDHFYGHFNTDVLYFDHTFAGGHDFQENGNSVKHEGEYATDVHGNQAARYINEMREPEKPFFLYVPFLAPHSPMDAKEEDIAKYPNRLDTPRHPAKTYAAMVHSLDEAVGDILKALDDQGVADNTIVLFFSDNGGYYNFGGVNTPLNGGKLEAYEGGIRVTSVVRWPDVLPANTVNENVISVLDVFPTLAEASGVEPLNVKKMDGFSRWDAVTGTGEKDRGEPLYFTSNVPIYNKFQYGVLDGPWKLVQHVNHLRRTTEVKSELYNVWSDPNESQDISAEFPEEFERLQNLLDKRLALHPIGGQYVKIQPHPGWRAPNDYAEVVIPADQVKEDMWTGFGPLATTVLQQTHGERGRIKYD
ncbi:MAG: arylsulfatase [Hyphomonadaceae bacterium]|nr:arylsulfatase [Hyphomonadaceae bacterium]